LFLTIFEKNLTSFFLPELLPWHITRKSGEAQLQRNHEQQAPEHETQGMGRRAGARKFTKSFEASRLA
jgi:hypothetical protein